MAAVEARVGTATVLFTDLVGSTALRSRIGEEAADALRVEHDELIGQAIASRNGVIVKHTGDGVMATFTAAVDAVAAAVAIQQAIERHSRRRTEGPLEVRVGISVGDVSFEGDDCFGLPVVEAQRLEAAAEGGRILCSEVVRHLARGRGGHEFAAIGDLTLKGLPEPVPAAEVVWEPVVHVAMPRDTPLPNVLFGRSAFELVGRDDELEVLTQAWNDAVDGRRRVVLVSGEPGIGKTRLTREVALVARDHGALVLAGRCDELLARPFGPFVEALRFQARLDVPGEWYGPNANELSRLVPELAVRPDAAEALGARSDAEGERARLFDAVTAWLRATAASVPVMLVLDDLQWADRETVLLLRHVVRETPNDALCVVGMYRSTDLDRGHPLVALLADLRREGTATAVELEGLPVSSVTEMLQRAAGHRLDPGSAHLATALYEQTDGNPLFAGEIVLHLVESGTLVQRDGRWTSDLSLEQAGLPESVLEAIGRRVARLDAESQRLLSLAAVIGSEFAVPVLADVAGVDEDRALDLLDAARSAGLVDEAALDVYRFGHALVRATLLEEQTATRKVRAHDKIAAAIERVHADDLDPFVADLAYHYGEAATAAAAKALDYSSRAGERAYGMAAVDDAAHWFGRALEHADTVGADVATRAHLLTRLGQAVWASGRGDARAHLLEAARIARDAGLYDAMAGALVVKVRQSFYRGQESDPEKIELLEHVLEHLDDEPSLRARAMGALASELVFVGDTTRRGSLLDEARVLAASSGDPLAIVDVASCHLDALPFSRRNAARMKESRSYATEALAAARALGDPDWVYQMLLQNGVLGTMDHDGRALRALLVEMGELPGTAPYVVIGRIVAPQMMATMEGRLVEADALSLEILDVTGAISPVEALVYAATMQLAVRREQGRLAELVPVWTAIAGQGPIQSAVAAFILAETGDLDAAAIALHARSGDGFGDIPDDLAWPVAAAMWSEVAALVRDRDAAALLHRLHTPFDGVACATGGIAFGPTARLLARLEDVLDRPADADRHYADAIEQSERLISPVWIARCRLDWAVSLLERGEAERARELVDAAGATMGTLTLPRLRDQMTDLRAQLSSA
jgi:class 3 adenylate cyclase